MEVAASLKDGGQGKDHLPRLDCELKGWQFLCAAAAIS